MKVVVNEQLGIQEIEIIINCSSKDETVQKIVSSLSVIDMKLTCRKDDEIFQLDPANILYIESVDRKTFLYTEQQIFETERRLYELEAYLENCSFFRASKAKCIVSLIIATVVVILFAAFVISLCGIYFGGLTGWQADIQTQFGSLLMPVPLRMNNFQFFIFSVLMYWLSSIGVAALICCCSALCKRYLTAFVAGAVIYIAPYFIRQFSVGGAAVGELILLFPVCSAKAQQVVRTSEHKLINLLPVACEMPIWIALFTAVSIFALFFLAYKHFSKHQVMN